MTALATLRGVVGVMPPWMSVRGAAILLLLAEATSGALRHKLVERGLGLLPPTVSRLCNTLAAYGLVERVRHTSHNVDFALTPAGRELALALESAIMPEAPR